ncbi:unnamed protein product [Brugia pahangi]|uniref:NADPH:adrenodoxin oxidoreductase, mitochondrial n=1 Tax=Brugia pahangi TaxID=6280 RepID=A0A0N4TZI9_BRUPA|nr:unnamed protein product [Brugia pahangi]
MFREATILKLCTSVTVSWIRRNLATSSRSPRIAVVGAGPAGLYVCAGVLRRLPQCYIDVYESNMVPYGLARYGIAPDHPEMKNCLAHFDRLFVENQDRLKLFCNVYIGRDIKFDELCSDYDAVVLAYGARRQRRLKIPGIDATNVFSGGDFVFWYNGILKLFCNVYIGRDIKFDELCSDYDAVVLAYGARRQRRLKIPGIDATNVFSGGDFVFWYNGMSGTKAPLLNCREAVTMNASNVAERLSFDLQKYGLKEAQITGSYQRLLSRNVEFLTWNDWKKIDEEEKRLGVARGKEREKLLSFKDLVSS